MPMIEPMFASAVDVRHVLVEAFLGFQRLGEQHPVDHVLQRRLGLAGLERLPQTRPQPIRLPSTYS